MPIPQPTESESKDDFISRCMSDSVNTKEFPEEDQRSAVCYAQWDNKGKEKKKLQTNIKTLSNQSRVEKYDGKDFLVLPAVLLTEGVHNGLYYPPEEIAKFPAAWNNRPIPIHHPQENGKPISCNTPNVLTGCVGMVFNTKYEEGKLKAELWVDQQKLKDLDTWTFYHLQAQKPIDISTGLWSDEINVKGEWRGEPYSAVIANIRPDHVALLPGQQGACSWKDGCGAPRINNEEEATCEENIVEQEKEINEQVTVNEGIPDEIETTPIEDKGFWHKFMNFFRFNKRSYEDVMRELGSLLPRSDGVWTYIVAVYDDYFIYSTEPSEEISDKPAGVPRKSLRKGIQTYKQSYGTNEKGEIVLVGDPVEGEMQADFVPKTNEVIDEVINNEEVRLPEQQEAEIKTNERNCCMDRLIDSIINNERTQFSEDDREWLKTLDEDKLNKLDVPEVEELEKQETEEAVEPKTNNDNEQIGLALSDVLASREFAQAVAMAVKTLSQRDRKTELVQQIKALKDLDFTDDELYEMPDTALEKLVKVNSGDFSGRGGNSEYVAEDDAPPEPPKILTAKKEGN